MPKAHTLSYLKLHIAILFFGYTAIFGELISLEAGIIVWYRMLFASLGFLVIPKLYRSLKLLSKQQKFQIAATGIIVMMHWVTFFGAIKASNVSITLCFIATTSLFTAFIEPILFKRKPSLVEIGLGMMIIPGIFLVFQFTSGYTLGIALALISACLAATFGSINKKFIEKEIPAISISFLELGTGWLGLTLLLPLYFFIEPNATLAITNWNDAENLLLLGILCTTIAYRLSVDALKHVSAFTAALSINLEPIYGILLAAYYFEEHKELDQGFYWGASLIIFAVFLNSFIQWKLKRAKKFVVQES